MCRSVIRMVNQPFIKPANEEGLKLNMSRLSNLKFRQALLEAVSLKVQKISPDCRSRFRANDFESF